MISVTGRVELEPAEPFDAEVAAAFNAHQRRVVAGRRLLGPDAVGGAVEAFARHGMATLLRPSPWRLGADRSGAADGLVRWLARRGVRAGAARWSGQAPAYARRRLAEIAEGRLTPSSNTSTCWRVSRDRRRSGSGHGCSAGSPSSPSWSVGRQPARSSTGCGWSTAASLAAAFGIGALTTVCCAWRWALVARSLGVGAAAAGRGRGLLPGAVPQHHAARRRGRRRAPRGAARQGHRRRAAGRTGGRRRTDGRPGGDDRARGRRARGVPVPGARRTCPPPW